MSSGAARPAPLAWNGANPRRGEVNAATADIESMVTREVMNARGENAPNQCDGTRREVAVYNTLLFIELFLHFSRLKLVGMNGKSTV